MAKQINSSKKEYKSIYAVPRGGVPIGVAVSAELGLPLVEEADQHSLIVDDLIDSGKTLAPYKQDTAVLYRKPHSPETTYCVAEKDGWVEFPYELTDSDIEANIVRILEFIGEDPTREGLIETPKRYVKFLENFMENKPLEFAQFDSEGYDEMIIQKNIPFFSICEHHLLPFFGQGTIAFLPDKRIVGLSKLARTLKHYASRLQNQERITSQVAQRLVRELNPKGVAVSLSARHLCMEMRGVKSHLSYTATTKLTGTFRSDDRTRAEFLSYVDNE